ncbi:hypothetical protein SVAN01_10149 [Stagonosporopsis vannaccii]|nr:hypothetical protein SVAN01_10149 [Stagonosporopsis vannaccii]
MPTTLPCFHLRMPAARDIVSPTRSIVLRLLSLPIFFVLPTTMPPLLSFGTFWHAEQLVSNSKQSRKLWIIVVVLITATITWTVIAYILQRKSQSHSANIVGLEKPAPQRTLERHDSAISQNQTETDHNIYLSSLQQEILSQTEKPIYPWVLPPQALPGPYDPMYYPLPAPSIRYKTVSSSPASIEGRHSISYTRFVPKAGTPFGEAVLYGTMTKSTNGWRRSHWNVTGG